VRKLIQARAGLVMVKFTSSLRHSHFPVILFISCLWGDVWGIELDPDTEDDPDPDRRCRRRILDNKTLFMKRFHRLRDLPSLTRYFEAGVDAEVEVGQCRYAVIDVSAARVRLDVTGVTWVKLLPKATPKRKQVPGLGRGAEAGFFGEEEDDVFACPGQIGRGADDVPSDVDSDGEVNYVVSDIDTDAEADTEEEEEEKEPGNDNEAEAEDGAAPPGTRGRRKKPKHSHTVPGWNDTYFTLINNKEKLQNGKRRFPNCKMLLLESLAVEAALGPTEKSKTIQIEPHDGDIGLTDDGVPVRTYLALRAWMIWRATFRICNGVKDCHFDWINMVSGRKLWWEQCVKDLKRDISDLSVEGGGTGCAATDKLIGDWCPEALQEAID